MSEATIETAAKFRDPDWTANGERRARVALDELRTLWINTGSLCNIECRNCYIDSSPTNDRLVYINAREVSRFYEEIAATRLPVKEIGFTGGEPFMNPDIIAMVEDALTRGFAVLILTNAMQPMLRPRVRSGLLALRDNFRDRLTLRVSLDHYTKERHEEERGPETFDKTVEGIDWLAWAGFKIALAGRTCWGESEADARKGYAALIKTRNWPVDADDALSLVLFPEMDARTELPEITESCWGILGKDPRQMMCASSRMVVKRKGAERPVVLPCTLLPYDPAFEMGGTLSEAARADGGMFEKGAVKLCHPYCAEFCVLGGGSCSG
jgi:uncharacterized Fe-S cluster-containing radical SAM superfamily protein